MSQVRDADANFQLAVALQLLVATQAIEVQHYGYQVLERLVWPLTDAVAADASLTLLLQHFLYLD